jgi:dTDP-glucose 4,6-dehydratase
VRDTILVTGGAGFIGSNFILSWIRERSSPVVNLDLLTYAGNPANLALLEGNRLYRLAVGDIRDARRLAALLREVQPRRATWIAPLPFPSCLSAPM